MVTRLARLRFIGVRLAYLIVDYAQLFFSKYLPICTY